REGTHRVRRARRAVARPFGGRRSRRARAEPRVEEYALGGDEGGLGGVDEVDSEVRQEGDAVREREPRGPQERGRPEPGPYVPDRLHERQSRGPQGPGVAENDELRPLRSRGRGGVRCERRVDQEGPGSDRVYTRPLATDLRR